MKNLLLLFLILTISTVISYSQRNANQIEFQQKAKEGNKRMNFEILDNRDNLFDIEESNGYYNDNSYGLKSYINDTEIIFEVRALYNAKANNLLAVFNLTQVGETAEKTNELINQRINNFVTGVKNLGLGEDKIYIDMIYLVPTFEYTVEKKLFSKTYNEVPTGFEMQKNIHISFTDINLVDDLVTLAAKNEIYDLVKLDFFVDKNEAINDTLINTSVDFLNRKLASFEKLNIKLDDKYHVSRDALHTVYPETQYTDYDAFVSQSIEAVKKNTGVTTIRKPQTVAYNQVPYDEFNIIINPTILEPVVQYMYILQVKYELEKPEKEKETENKYILVTPNGELKPINTP